MCSGKSGCIQAKLVVFRKKLVLFRQKLVYSGITCCILAKVVVVGQNGLDLGQCFVNGKIDCIRANFVYSGKNGCIRAKVVVFG